MKKSTTSKYTKGLYIIGALLLIVGIFLTILTLRDIKTIKNSIIKDKTAIELKIKNYNDKLENIYKHMNSTSKEDILFMRESVLNLKKQLNDFEIKKEDEIKELFLSQIKNWAFIIAVFTLLFVLTGLEWNIKQKVNRVIEEEVKKDVDKIRHTIDSEIWLSDLRKTTKMLVLNKTDTSLNEDVKLMLELTELEYKLRSIPNLTLDKIKPLLNGYNVVFIENANSGTEQTWDKTEVKNNLKLIGQFLANKEIPVFYFNTAKNHNDTVRFEALDSKNYYTSFANTEANIYPNLKNLLVVRKLIQDKNA